MLREEWVNTLCKIALPILECSATGQLRSQMPRLRTNHQEQYLEAIGRVICGIAPWIESGGNELALRAKCKALIIKTLDSITDKSSNDYISFSSAPQSLVDGAYLAHGLLRAPSIWEGLSGGVRRRVIESLKRTRQFKPTESNWLLFASMVEVFMMSVGAEYNAGRLWRGVTSFDSLFYMGDGVFGDGATFSMDYYNSYLIHPMMIDILRVCADHKLPHAADMFARERRRFRRYVEIQERTVSPEGTYPTWGRTQICRLGAFHAMSQGVLLGEIPDGVGVSQIRGAMDALLQRFVACDSNFEERGFLSIGICGSQPAIAESYVSMGSAYHCCTFFVCLGLPPESEFWSSEPRMWSSRRAFSGLSVSADKALCDITLRDIVVRSVRLAWRTISVRLGL